MHGPEELEPIYLEEGINNKILNKKKVYITQDPDLDKLTNGRASISYFIIARVIYGDDSVSKFTGYRIPVDGAFTRESNNSNASIINCEDVSENLGVILFKLGDETKIYSENDCVILEAKNPQDLRRVAIKLTYSLIGVF
jgi:hypothetical protein